MSFLSTLVVFLVWLAVAAVAAILVLRLIFRLPPRTGWDHEPPISGKTSRFAAALRAKAEEHPGLTGIAALADGPDAFAARVALIEAAEISIDAQYYIWHDDLTGATMLCALKRAADRGVRVRLLVDDNGIAGLDAGLIELDAHPNATVRIFNPFVLRRPKLLNYFFHFRRLNRRMHNKSLTIDGAATIVGGRNIGDEYFGAGEGAVFVDLDVVAVGEIVAEVEKDFQRYWDADAVWPASAILPGDKGHAVIERRAAVVAQQPGARSYGETVEASKTVADMRAGRFSYEWTKVELVSDDPKKALGQIPDEELLLSAIDPLMGNADRRLDIVSAYFVPGPRGTATLVGMQKRGVAVRVLTNALEATDVVPVHAGYAKRRKRLLRAGLELYELKRGVSGSTGRRDQRALGRLGSSGSSLHAKTFAVDGRRIYVGSFNFDPRSHRLNTEMGFVIDSEALTCGVHEAFEEAFPGLAYKVELNEGRLSWLIDGKRLDEEPGASLGKRALLAIVGLLPVEWLL